MDFDVVKQMFIDLGFTANNADELTWMCYDTTEALTMEGVQMVLKALGHA